MIEIYNEDCFVTMKKLPQNSIDVVLTSPPYNTNVKAKGGRTLMNTMVGDPRYNYVRYDSFSDGMSNEDYCLFTVNLFNNFDSILKKNGCVLYNLSYGSENTEGMFLAIADILRETAFTLADVVVWKKHVAFPNSCSPNKLTRICEYIFVFCRKEEILSFHCNKKCTSIRKTGQKAFENIYNFIECKNNDEPCPYNKATYSTDLCRWLLKLYAPKEGMIYDPFLGSGTTAVACKEMWLNCIGSELSARQCEWAKNRLNRQVVKQAKNMKGKKKRNIDRQISFL